MDAPRRHALIIEDEAIIALEVEALLVDLGFATFDIADTPDAAAEAAARRRPDLITADYRIIGGTGVEAVRRIEAELGLIPVVYITGNVRDVAGFGAPVVEKPIRPQELDRACTRACAPRGEPHQLAL